MNPSHRSSKLRGCCWKLLIVLIVIPSIDADTLKLHPLTFPKNVLTGETVTGLCSVTSPSSQISFRWLKDGRDLSSEPTVQIRTFPELSTISIGPVTEEHAGNFTCQVSSGTQSDRYTAALVVNVPPKWIRQPEDASVVIGQDVVLFCMVGGLPPPTVTWAVQANGGSEAVETTEQRTVMSDGTLSIQRVRPQDEGFYTCQASNGVGQPLSKVVSLSVIVPARFEEKFTVKTVRRGESATLECDAIGDQPMEVSWLKDKAPLDPKDNSRYEKLDSARDGGLLSEILVQTTERSDAALYTCLAKNQYGTAERNIKLLVVEVPAQPLDVRVQEVWSRSVSLTWTAPYSGNSPITKFIIHYWREKYGPQRLEEQVIPNTKTSTVIKDLRPGVNYAVTVVAQNEIGEGLPSDPIAFTTGEEEPGSPPTDVWAKPQGPTSILVTWKPPPQDYCNGEIKGYNVGFKLEGSSHTHSFKAVDTRSASDSYKYTLTNLIKATRYSIIVKAFNQAGNGPPSQELTVRTLQGDVPTSPPLELLTSSDTSISLKWTQNPAISVPVTGYTLHYQKDGGSWQYIALLPSDYNIYTLRNLKSGSLYHVYLTASNQFGKGDPSTSLAVQTSGLGLMSDLPPYLDLSIFVPAAACILAFIVVTTVIAVFVRRSHARRNLEKALDGGGKQCTYGPGSQRYIDIDKARCATHPDLGTPAQSLTPYSTIPSQDDGDTIALDSSRHEMKTFTTPHQVKEGGPKPYPKPESLKKKADIHVYDTAA